MSDPHENEEPGTNAPAKGSRAARFFRQGWERMSSWDKERVAYLLLGAIVFGVLALGVVRSGAWTSDEAGKVTFFRIATGATGGTYFRMGEVLAGVISRPPGGDPCELGGRCGVDGLIAVVKSSPGSVANVRNVATGIFESGLVQANVLDAAFKGEGIFKGEAPRENLRVVANLYPEALHLVAAMDSEIETVSDLKGKRVAIGSKGSGTWVDAHAIMNEFGIRKRSLTLLEEDANRAADLLLSGEIDAFFMITGAPAPLIRTLILRDAGRLVPIEGAPAEGLRIKNAHYEGYTIEEGVYPGTGAINTIAVGAMWVTRADMPEELVHDITRALFDERSKETLALSHPEGALIMPETAVRGVPIFLHPGAERYYFEKGILAR